MTQRIEFDKYLKTIFSALNKANLKGTYVLEQSCLLKSTFDFISLGDKTEKFVFNEKQMDIFDCLKNIIEPHLEKACEKGIFTLDECYVIKLSLINIVECIKKIE